MDETEKGLALDGLAEDVDGALLGEIERVGDDLAAVMGGRQFVGERFAASAEER